MANAGDTFTVELNQAQLEWGTFDLLEVAGFAMAKDT